jgi:hypothetical protein
MYMLFFCCLLDVCVCVYIYIYVYICMERERGLHPPQLLAESCPSVVVLEAPENPQSSAAFQYCRLPNNVSVLLCDNMKQ